MQSISSLNVSTSKTTASQAASTSDMHAEPSALHELNQRVHQVTETAIQAVKDNTPQLTLADLPLDCVTLIMEHVSSHDRNMLASTCRLFKHGTLEASRKQDGTLLLGYINTLREEIQKEFLALQPDEEDDQDEEVQQKLALCPTTIEKLQTLKENIEQALPVAPSIGTIQHIISHSRTAIAEIFANNSLASVINNLLLHPKPLFFQQLGPLISCYETKTSLAIASIKKERTILPSEIIGLVETFLALDETEEALTITGQYCSCILKAQHHGEILRQLVNQCLKKGLVLQILYIIINLKPTLLRTQLLEHISHLFKLMPTLFTCSIFTCQRQLNQNPDHYARAMCFLNGAILHIANDNAEKALTLIHRCTKEEQLCSASTSPKSHQRYIQRKDKTLQLISTFFLTAGYYQKAVHAAQLISNPSHLEMYSFLIEELIKVDQVELVIPLINALFPEHKQGYIYKLVEHQLVLGRCLEARELLTPYRDDTDATKRLRDIAQKYSSEGNIAEFAKTVSIITDEPTKHDLLHQLCKTIKHTKQYESFFVLANHFQDTAIIESILLYATKIAVTHDAKDMLLRIYKQLPDQISRELFHQDIALQYIKTGRTQEWIEEIQKMTDIRFKVPIIFYMMPLVLSNTQLPIDITLRNMLFLSSLCNITDLLTILTEPQEPRSITLFEPKATLQECITQFEMLLQILEESKEPNEELTEGKRLLKQMRTILPQIPD